MIGRLRSPATLADLAFSVVPGQRTDLDRFERQFAEAFGFPYGLFFSYGRGALFCLLKALAWRNRTVLCPAYTCSVIPHAILLSGNVPRFVDSGLDHFLVPAENWRAAVTPSTTMALMTPMFGYPLDRRGCESELRNAAPSCFLLYDVAQGFGVEDQDGLQTSNADGALFGLGIGKVITTLYGGVLTLRDEALFREVRALRDRTYRHRGLGRTLRLLAYGVAVGLAFREPTLTIVDLLERRTHLLDRFTSYYYATDRPRLPDDVETHPVTLQARLGLRQLRDYPRLIAERRLVSEWYETRLKTEGVRVFDHISQPNYSVFPLALAHRQTVMAAMLRHGIQIGTLIDYCCADLPGYESHAGTCPQAAGWARGMINLPNWPGLGLRRAGKVVEALLYCRERAPERFQAFNGEDLVGEGENP